MANTPHGAWAGCPNFGLRDCFEQARVRPELPQLAIQEANLALNDLGITNYRVESIAKEPQANRDVDEYVITLASVADNRKTFSVTV